MSQSIVLLHGWGLNDAIWSTVAPQLAQQFDIHALNLPGFGGQPWTHHDQDIAAVADKIAHYIQAQVPGQRAAVLGWSMGGLVATELALNHPKHVSHLLCVASAPCFIAQPEQEWPGIEPAVLAQFQRQLCDDFETTLKRFLAVQAMGSPTARQDIKALQEKLLERAMPAPEALRTGLDWLAQSDYRHPRATLKMPLHRAYGRLDTLVPVAQTEHIQHEQLHVFQHSGHAPFMNEPEAFIAWVESVLLESTSR